MNTVNLRRLKAVVARLLDEAIAEHGSAEFELEENLYWKFDFVKQFDMTSKPTIDVVGSLHDDWEMTHWLADELLRLGATA